MACTASLGFSCSDSTSNDNAGENTPVYTVDPKTGLRASAFGPVPPLPVWEDNPSTEAKKELGRALFTDPRLSGSGKTSCPTCHFSINEFQSATPLDLPDRSYPNLTPSLSRHTPSLLNVVYAPMMRWDGAYFTDVYDMGVLPLAEANMNTGLSLPADQVEELDIPASQAALYTKLTETFPGYIAAYKAAFDQDISQLSAEQVWRLTGMAIATYLRVAVSRDAPFDRWNAGDDNAIDASAIRGFALFEGKARCVGCHSGPFFSDFAFHNVSTSLPLDDGTRPDEGRFRVTQAEKDRGAFLTPGLRSVAMTSPYYHDGSETGLAPVIRRKLGQGYAIDPDRDELLNNIPALSDAEIDDLVAFLKSLTGEPVSPADLAPPQSYP